MSGIKKQDGFTLIEILVAMFIMALGFLSLAEMEFLSLRQKQRAELGTTAINTVEFASETDLAEVKRRYLLNATAYLTALAGYPQCSGSQPPPCYDLSYCNGSATSICSACPCDPLNVIMGLSTPPESSLGTTESTCASIDIENLDPLNLVNGMTNPACTSNANTDLFLVKTAVASQAVDATTGITTVTVLTVYAPKTQNEVNKSGLSVSTSNSLASQSFQITADISDYSRFIAGWNTVRNPNIP